MAAAAFSASSPPAALSAAPLWDAHCHLQLGSAPEEEAALARLPPNHRVGLMSVNEECWERIRRIKAGPNGAKVRLALGIHPWFAHAVGSGSSESEESACLEELRRRLVADPAAIVGEIGLDAQWVPPAEQKVMQLVQQAKPQLI